MKNRTQDSMCDESCALFLVFSHPFKPLLQIRPFRANFEQPHQTLFIVSADAVHCHRMDSESFVFDAFNFIGKIYIQDVTDPADVVPPFQQVF
jgi:hypothetical protein